MQRHKHLVEELPPISQLLPAKGTCINRHCMKNITQRLPPIHQSSSKDEERWEIKSLPSDWATISKPSKIIDNLMKKRQTEHEHVLNKIKDKFKAINIDIESQIRLGANLLIKEFSKNEETIQGHIKTIDIDSNQIGQLQKEIFETTSLRISEIHENRISNIEGFYTFLKELEGSRTNSYKEVLKSAFQKLSTISYVLPHDLQIWFENKIREINQMILSNLRCYAGLYQDLHLRMENENRLRLQRVDYLYSQWKDIKRKEALLKLNKKMLGNTDCETIMLQSEQGKTTSRLFITKEHNMKEMWTSVSPLPITEVHVDAWTKITQNTVDELDFCARKLITLYKMAVVQVFNGYFDEFQELSEQMVDMGLVDSTESTALGLEICKPTFETITRQYSDDVMNLEILWESVITQLQSKLQTTYKFLKSAGHLWDQHFERTEEAQKVVLQELHNLIKKNDNDNQENEIQINITLDTMRQAASEDVLEEELVEVTALLNVIKNTYNFHYESEIKVVQKYEGLILLEIDVLQAELELFLHKYPKNARLSTKQKKRASQCSLTNDTLTVFLPQQMKQCEFQVDAVQNWMYGLQEAIERYKSTCKEEIIETANAWITDHKRKLKKRLEVKLAVHTPRLPRLKMDVYDIRLAELRSHFDRVKRHEAGAEQEVLALREFYLECDEKRTKIIEELNKNIEIISKKLEKARNSTEVQVSLASINYSSIVCSNKIKELEDAQELLYMKKLSTISEAGMNLLKQVKMFNEDGNFHCDEVKQLTKDMKNIESSIKKKLGIIKKEYQAKLKKNNVQIQQMEAKINSRLITSLEEFEFNESSTALIKSMQTDLKKEVYNYKLIERELEHHMKEIEDKQKDTLFNLDTLAEFIDKFNQIEQDLLNISNCLCQQTPVINVTKMDSVSLSNSAEESKVASTKQTQITSEFFNYLSLLFNNELVENNTLMYKVLYQLYKSFETIQNGAKVFYEGHSNIINKKKIQPSYDHFMKEVLEKYNFYHLQCELLWLNLVNEYLEIIDNLYKFSLDYHKMFLENHFQTYMEKLKEKHREFSDKTSNSKNDTIKLLQKAHNQLKPLHGYKKNRHLLSTLKNHFFEIVTDFRNIDIDSMLNSFREDINNNANAYQSEYIEIKKTFQVTYCDCFKKLFNVPLIHQFEAKLLHIIMLLEDKSKGINDDNLTSNKAYYNRLKSIEITSEFEIILTNIKVLQTTINAFDNEETYITEEEYLKIIQEEQDKQIAYSKEEEEKWSIEINNLENMFNADIQKILNLYTVKYKNKSPE